MSDLSPAEELREAARLMRERAGTAKDLTGDGNGDWFPWSVVQDTKWQDWPEPQPVPDDAPFGETGLAQGRYVPTGEAFVAHARYAHDQEEDWHEAEFFAGPMPEGVACYIASVHPLVALAVADWLDAAAETAWRTEAEGTHVHPESHALKVARAYLERRP